MTGAAMTPRSCASCGVSSCGMHQRHGRDGTDAPTGMTSWLLDDVWPEYASYLNATRGTDDQIVAPGMFGRPLLDRYRWPSPVKHRATVATVQRHWAMRRVARAAGHVRQARYLQQDAIVAESLAKAIDYRARHLVVAQSWLPWLDAAGALGGRSYDVLMQRYPFADIHHLLDRAARDFAGRPDPTITDFRAPDQLVKREMQLLAKARRIITPHYGIAALFPLQAMKLAWHKPSPVRTRTPGDRLAFIGPALGRNRPDLARAYALAQGKSLILLGPAAAHAPVWQGFAVEHRAFGPSWLDDIGTIVHPATMTAQPRRLLEALAHGVSLVATPESGLDLADFTVVPAVSAQQG